MKPTPSIHPAHWRGAIRLTQDGVIGLADLVEAMHLQIARPFSARIAAGEAPRARGISGLVYKSIRGVTRLAGGSGDALLAALAARLPAAGLKPPSAEREAVIAALNGVLGDHLAESGNPLAVPMAFRHQGVALRLQPASLAASLRNVGPKPLVLLHGLCMNDLQWRCKRADGLHDHGAALARDLGHTPVYLHYNSGRHIADNGLAFAEQMEALLAAWPVAIAEVNLLAHSMGGLVARSAIEQGRRAGHAWVERIDRLVFLGTPHHGAPLERGGNWIDVLLGISRYSAPFARLARLRSAGITDLRHGHLLPEDAGHDRFARTADARRPLPLPDGVACYAVAATVRHSGHLGSRLLGDGLVPLASALGRHHDPQRVLAFAPERQFIAEGLGHLQLLGDETVYRQLRQWFAQPLAR